jgi:hypothetical protein
VSGGNIIVAIAHVTEFEKVTAGIAPEATFVSVCASIGLFVLLQQQRIMRSKQFPLFVILVDVS